jgi:hypothetical protein
MKISQTLLLFLTFFSIIYCEFEAEEEARIRIDGKNEWKIDRQPSEEYLYIATAYYSPGINESGWDFLSITTNNQFSDELQAEAAGRLEASLTKNKIYTHYTNMLSTAGHLKNDTAQFFIRQEEFLLSKKDEYKSDSILYNAYLLYLQFKGLRDQYNKEADDDKKIEDVEFNVMNSFGDVFDINSKYNRPSFDEMDKEEIYNYFALNNHCSAIFKLKYDLSDIFFGHNSWYYSNMMTKMFKEYNLNFNHDSIKTHNVMFSSYPGSIVSNDDFYFTSTGLVVIETTNANYNQSAFDLINEESLLCWQRVQISNRMSGSAKEWTETFAIYNSGTYNNQYMVLDTKKIEIGNITKIPDNSLMIIEQMPGFIEANDVTNHLKFGYWPSYNVPYSKNISDYANVTNTINSKPERNMKLYSQYNSCSRAKIMRRDQNNIHDIESMKYFMHYNDYKNDPFSEGEPGESIAARYDLREKNARCYGAYDTKLSSVQEIKKSDKKPIYLYCGATRKVEPFFNFNCDACKNVKHEGIPDEPNFNWTIFNNKLNFDE